MHDGFTAVMLGGPAFIPGSYSAPHGINGGDPGFGLHKMARETSKELVQVNIGWLRQALALLDQMDDETFSTSPSGLAPHRVGSHLRHVVEFYQCFLDGLATSRIDYDARKRDESIERRRQSAMTSIRSIVSK